MPGDFVNSLTTGPDEKGRFGGRFASGTPTPPILKLEAEWSRAKEDPAFWAEMDDL